MKTTAPPYLTSGQGLTQTTANHLCNIAKEYYQEALADIETLDFLDIRASLMSSENYKTLQIGNTAEDLKKASERIARIGELTAFIAYFRNCIEDKARILKDIKHTTPEEYEELMGLESLKEPEQADELTLTEYLSMLPIKELQTYLELEAMAATYGKVIHPNQCLSKAREALQKYSRKNIEIEGTGRDAIVREYTPSIASEVIEEIFFTLQSNYRDYQARFNNLKHKYDKEVQQHNEERRKEYLVAIERYRSERDKRQEEYLDYITAESRELSAMKFVVPTALVGTLHFLRNLYKESSNTEATVD